MSSRSVSRELFVVAHLAQLGIVGARSPVPHRAQRYSLEVDEQAGADQPVGIRGDLFAYTCLIIEPATSDSSRSRAPDWPEYSSAAVNESMSDVFGSMIKQRVRKETAATADWLIGAGLLVDPQGKSAALDAPTGAPPGPMTPSRAR